MNCVCACACACDGGLVMESVPEEMACKLRPESSETSHERDLCGYYRDD